MTNGCGLDKPVGSLMADLCLALHSFIGANFSSSRLWYKDLTSRAISPEPPIKTFCINNLNSFGQDLAGHHHREWRAVDTTWTFTWDLKYVRHSLQLRWRVPFGDPGLTWESCNVSVTFLWLQWKSWPRQVTERSSYSSRGVRVHHYHGKEVVEQAGTVPRAAS